MISLASAMNVVTMMAVNATAVGRVPGAKVGGVIFCLDPLSTKTPVLPYDLHSPIAFMGRHRRSRGRGCLRKAAHPIDPQPNNC